jgi:hypothetical protein
MKRKKNYYQKRIDLHKDCVADIVAMMVDKGVTEVDLLGSTCDHAFIMGVPDFDWDIDYMEMEVSKVYYEDCQLVLDVVLDVDTEELAASNENGDISAAYQLIKANDFSKVMPTAGIDSVYDSVYQVLYQGA